MISRPDVLTSEELLVTSHYGFDTTSQSRQGCKKTRVPCGRGDILGVLMLLPGRKAIC